MTYTTDTIKAELQAKWGWFLALGVILLIFGALAAANIMVATTVSVFYVGLLMIAAGVVEIVHAFSVKGWGNTIFAVAAGLLYTIAGIFAFIDPVMTSKVITLFLGIALIVAGVVRIVHALSDRNNNSRIWILFSGVITALAGTVILIGWPVNSLWILGLFLAIDLLIQGVAYTMLGLGLRKV